MDIAAYLERIRYRGPLTPTAETLRQLQVAHLLAVPFENLSIHSGEPIELDDAALFRKVVARRRGGFCYELNGLFAALLRALGFEVAMLSAAVMGAEEFGPEFDHMALRVASEEPEPWLVDVGFGDSFREPLRLAERGEQAQGGQAYRIEDAGEGRLVVMRRDGEDPWKAQYRFGLEPHEYADYAAMCHYHQTSPRSHFTQRRLCSLATPDGRVTLSGMRLITTQSGERQERELADEREYDQALRQLFGIELPAGLSPAASAHYEAGVERGRLARGSGRLELLRTQEILERYLPPAPAVVVDVGGGPGLYAGWLARRGYEVHLIDAVPLHVAQAAEASRAQPEHPIASLTVGDARRLDRPDASADAVLLLGPLYHLTERQDRLAALTEARRVLKPGGVLFAAGISRFASALDGLRSGFLDDPDFANLVERDLTDGQHRNPTGHPYYFTTAFFHHPDELRQEVAAAGLTGETMLAIEGPAWLLQDFDAHWDDPDRRARLLRVVRRMEGDPSVLGVSAHLMAVARKKS